MYNQSGLTSNLYGDIFRMREFFIKDMVMKNNIEKIKSRPINAKTSLLKPANIYSLKKPSSPKPKIKSPIKTFIPILNIQKTSQLNTSPTVSKSRSKFDTISVSKYSYQYKSTTNISEKNYEKHKNYVNHLLQAKRRDSLNKSIVIDKENQKFGKKLSRVNSPLSRNRLNESYTKIKEYGNIAKKIKPDLNLNIKKINHVKSHLPPLLIKGKSNKKFNFVI